MRRRTVLAAAVGGAGLWARPLSAAATTPTATSSAEGPTSEEATGEGPPVVDNAGPPDETVVVDVRVTDEAGDPVAGVLVELEDRGGTPDDRLGETGPDGRLRFLEAVGPSPCNTQTLKLPAYGRAADLGCNGGGTRLQHQFTLGPEATPATVDPPNAGTPTPTLRVHPRPTPTTDRTPTDAGWGAGSGGWLDGWALLASWFAGVFLLGPVVLGALAVAGELAGPGEDGDDP